MEHFSNIAEPFFREVRRIEIYRKDSLTFSSNFSRSIPTIDDVQYVIDIIPENFKRTIIRKTQKVSYFHEIELGFPLLRLDPLSIQRYQDYFNKKEWVVILVSNDDKLVLGNNREPLRIQVLDNITLDNSGNDQYWMQISGKTIVPPIPIPI